MPDEPFTPDEAPPEPRPLPQPAAPWARASAEPDHPLAGLDGMRVGEDVQLRLWLGPHSRAGARYFRLYLDAGHAQSVEPVATGLAYSGTATHETAAHETDPDDAAPGHTVPSQRWVEVLDFRPALLMSDGRNVEVPAGIELQLFEALAAHVPPGGHLMVEYDSPARSGTAQALAVRVPPIATPLGALMQRVGCGVAFRDWDSAAGGRAGPRRLQGYRAQDEAHRLRRDAETIAAAQAYLDDDVDRDWAIDAICRPLAQAAIDRLTDETDRAEG